VEFVIDARGWVGRWTYLDSAVCVPEGRGDFVDEFLRNETKTWSVWSKSIESGGAETYQDIFVGSTLWPDNVALKVLAHRGLLLELHHLADQFEHYFSIKRVIQVLWVDQRHVFRVCGAEGGSLGIAGS
jgi:hypothetical protein